MNNYQNPASTIEARVEDLLSRMELDEKIAQMHAVWLFLAEDGGGAEYLSVGARQGLAPVLDVARDARWGRTEETFGGDPY